MLYRFQTHKQNLIAILMDYAPNGAAQQKLTVALEAAEREIQLAHETKADQENATIRMLAYCIADGLLHGRWPWVVAPHPTPGINTLR